MGGNKAARCGCINDELITQSLSTFQIQSGNLDISFELFLVLTDGQK